MHPAMRTLQTARRDAPRQRGRPVGDVRWLLLTLPCAAAFFAVAAAALFSTLGIAYLGDTIAMIA